MKRAAGSFAVMRAPLCFTILNAAYQIGAFSQCNVKHVTRPCLSSLAAQRAQEEGNTATSVDRCASPPEWRPTLLAKGQKENYSLSQEIGNQPAATFASTLIPSTLKAENLLNVWYANTTSTWKFVIYVQSALSQILN